MGQKIARIVVEDDVLQPGRLALQQPWKVVLVVVEEGNGPQRSAFLSAFFSLVGTHGIHVTSGLLWLFVLMLQVGKKGVTDTNRTRLMCLSLFWHFLDIVWICVFTVVYLMGCL